MHKKDNQIHKIIRVDHAGELGAKWIYEGQLRWMRDPETKNIIQHMYDQEIAHLAYFEGLIQQRRVRPTVLMPLWKWVGRTAGAVSAMMGAKAAMACTEAVEDVIDQHYADQIKVLESSFPEESDLIQKIKQFREDECNHRDTAAEYNQHPSPTRKLVKKALKLGVLAAIKVSKRF